ncbi:MAG: hypothetical protein ACI9OJ_000923 [Myxococcota bacterium]|jgi:hypothetical protein
MSADTPDAGPIAPGVALVENREGPNDLIVSGGYAYWLQPSGVYRVLESGGEPEAVQVPSGVLQAYAVTDDTLYWATTEEGVSRIRGELLAGGPTLIDATNPHTIDVLSAGPHGVFWGAAGPQDGNLWRFSDAGLVQHAQSGAVSIVTDATHVFWSDGQFVWRSLPDGQEAERLSGGQIGTASLSLNDTHVFWVTEAGDIYRVKKTGGSDQTVSTGALIGARSTTLKGDTVYVAYRGTTAGGGPGIGRVVVGSGTLESLLELSQRPPSFVLSGDAIIWSDFQAGAIRTIPVP